MSEELKTETLSEQINYRNGGILYVKYKIDSENKVVVCTIEIDYHITNSNNVDTPLGNFYYYEAGRSFKGKARCTGDDVFDKRFGQNLAFNKAMAKLLNAQDKFLTRTANESLEWAKRTQDECLNVKIKRDKFIERINKTYE